MAHPENAAYEVTLRYRNSVGWSAPPSRRGSPGGSTLRLYAASRSQPAVLTAEFGAARTADWKEGVVAATLRTLGEIASRASMLQVSCSRCERRGRCWLDTLIARHGADAGARVIVPALTAGWPQRNSPALIERSENVANTVTNAA